MGGILQPPCPCGRHIGSCCLPQTRLLAHFIPHLAHSIRLLAHSAHQSSSLRSMPPSSSIPRFTPSQTFPQLVATFQFSTTHPGVSAAHETRRHPKQVAPSPTSIPSFFHLSDITENTQHPPRHNLRYFLDVFSSYMSKF